MTERNDLEALAIALVNAKQNEDEAKKARIEAEEKLAEAIGGADMGTTSAKCGRIGVSVKRGYSYRIDAPQSFAKEFPDFVKVRESIEIIPAKYEVQREADSKLYREMSEHVTVTPRKVAVELKL